MRQIESTRWQERQANETKAGRSSKESRRTHAKSWVVYLAVREVDVVRPEQNLVDNVGGRAVRGQARCPPFKPDVAAVWIASCR